MYKNYLASSRILQVFAYLLLFSIFLYSSTLMAEQAKMEKVKYCTGPVTTVNTACAGGATSPAHLRYWDSAGVPAISQYNTYLSIINEPPKENVRKVLFISAGQQVEPGKIGQGFAHHGDGYPNVLTGQPDNYKNGCKGSHKSCMRTIDSRSLLARLRTGNRTSKIFDESSTLIIAINDMRFGYFRNLSKKTKIEEAWWNFFTSKFNPKKVEFIILAGQSRGGCMMFRLGNRFRNKNPATKHIPLIIQGYDPVCTTVDKPSKSGLELPASPGYHYNPLDPDHKKKSYIVNMNVLFPSKNRKHLYILDIHGGGEVGKRINGGRKIRAFTWKAKNTDLGWWKQKWVNIGHNDMGGDYAHSWATLDVGVRHILASIDKIWATNYYSLPEYPVDINGDGISDVLMRWQDPVKGLQIRSHISDRDGPFKTVDFSLGDGSAANKLPALVGYFNKDKYSDILLRYRDPVKGLVLRTKFSNGDGTFSSVEYVAGDGVQVDYSPGFVGDIDGDGLSDLLLAYQHPVDGLHLRVKFANGDGSFRESDFYNGDGVSSFLDGSTGLDHGHVGDWNGDKKTDYLYYFSDAKGLHIRSFISKGDGTFAFRDHVPQSWMSFNNLQSFVGRFNKDNKSDFLILDRDHNDSTLTAKVYISNGDGRFWQKGIKLHLGREVDDYEALVLNVNGDRLSDILFRYNDSGLIKGIVFLTQLDGSFKRVDLGAIGKGSLYKLRTHVGKFDTNSTSDLFTRWRTPTSTKFTEHVYLGQKNGRMMKKNSVPNEWNDGLKWGTLPTLTGPTRWGGGATYSYCGRPRAECMKLEKAEVRDLKANIRAVNLGAIKEAVGQKGTLGTVSPKSTPKAVKPKTVPKAVTPKSVPKAVKPKTVPKTVTPKTVPKTVTPKTVPKTVTPKSIPNSVTPRSVPKALTPRSVLKAIAPK